MAGLDCAALSSIFAAVTEFSTEAVTQFSTQSGLGEPRDSVIACFSTLEGSC